MFALLVFYIFFLTFDIVCFHQISFLVYNRQLQALLLMAYLINIFLKGKRREHFSVLWYYTNVSFIIKLKNRIKQFDIVSCQLIKKNILINVDRLKKKIVLRGVPAFFISHMLFVLINFISFKNCNPLLLFELCLLVTPGTFIAILLIQLKVSGVKCLKKIMFV